ncbi:hypothetical protein ATE92_0659 [Ulvibacter sp. MAR_2010_11]|uniref:TIGR04282 family arsenosugar biosynthesis glycosyltransferase n=1 Tax=Ulvibacter sp. MAR_2010_11 TaxID=1250229 RepID=UPI000C2CC742|nr:TIGR04282 family arsenosugar biosynthesis glycosyltransferase [Ulvibacter sp. MAR_2010_11]PKA82528.1 hypothetical protein ATE92_0659 [Ulvibacter sp. MAR_2010_11]
MAVLTKKDTAGGAEFAKDFHFPASKKALIIFTRNPELGKCKTRLAATIGDEKALKIYNFLLAHTVAITKPVSADKFVFYSEQIWKDDCWDSEIFRKKLQEGTDLGERMQNAFSEIFTMGYEQAIIIGSDMYDIDSTHLEKAFTALKMHDFVIGPATDGGYYLLGMRHVKPELFSNKQWGTNSVLDSTLTDLKNESLYKLPLRNDVDIYEDIKDNPVFQQLLNQTEQTI